MKKKWILVIVILQFLYWGTQQAEADHYSWAVGTSIGGGYRYSTGSATPPLFFQTPVTSGVLLPTLEFNFFFSKNSSLDLQVPLGNMLLMPLLMPMITMVSIVPTSFSLFYTLHYQTPSLKFLLGPGIEPCFALILGPEGNVYIPGAQLSFRLGIEFFAGTGNFGLQIRIKPFIEGGIILWERSSKTQGLLGGGALIEIAFLFYQGRRITSKKQVGK